MHAAPRRRGGTRRKTKWPSTIILFLSYFAFINFSTRSLPRRTQKVFTLPAIILFKTIKNLWDCIIICGADIMRAAATNAAGSVRATRRMENDGERPSCLRMACSIIIHFCHGRRAWPTARSDDYLAIIYMRSETMIFWCEQLNLAGCGILFMVAFCPHSISLFMFPSHRSPFARSGVGRSAVCDVRGANGNYDTKNMQMRRIHTNNKLMFRNYANWNRQNYYQLWNAIKSDGMRECQRRKHWQINENENWLICDAKGFFPFISLTRRRDEDWRASTANWFYPRCRLRAPSWNFLINVLRPAQPRWFPDLFAPIFIISCMPRRHLSYLSPLSLSIKSVIQMEMIPFNVGICVCARTFAPKMNLNEFRLSISLSQLHGTPPLPPTYSFKRNAERRINFAATNIEKKLFLFLLIRRLSYACKPEYEPKWIRTCEHGSTRQFCEWRRRRKTIFFPAKL